MMALLLPSWAVVLGALLLPQTKAKFLDTQAPPSGSPSGFFLDRRARTASSRDDELTAMIAIETRSSQLDAVVDDDSDRLLERGVAQQVEIEAEVTKAWPAAAASPVMDAASHFRVIMCLGRTELLEHQQCMDFTNQKCAEKSSSGAELCKEFKSFLVSKCALKVKSACDNLCKARRRCESKKASSLIETHATRSNGNTTVLAQGPNVVAADTDGHSDGDGVADAEDDFPFDLKCQVVSQAGCEWHTDVDVPLAPNPKAVPTGMDKKLRELPEQGYNEHSPTNVLHKNVETHTEDWQTERPDYHEAWLANEWSENVMHSVHNHKADWTMQACKDHMDTSYCQLYMRKHEGVQSRGDEFFGRK
jgi:hypothetical protein